MNQLFGDNSAGVAGKGGCEMLYVGDDADATMTGEFDGGGDFGEHRARLEIAVFDETGNIFCRNFVQGFLVGQAVIDVDIWYGGHGYEDISMD